MPFQSGKEKAFQAWKSCLYLDLLVSSSCCQSSFCEAWKERRLLFEAGKVLKFPVWNEKVFPIWKKGFQPWKSCLYLLPIVKTTFAKLGRKKKIIFEAGKVLEFAAWEENVFPVWKFKFLNPHGHLPGTSQPYLRNLKQLSSALVHLYTLGLLCLLCYNSLPFLYYGRLCIQT